MTVAPNLFGIDVAGMDVPAFLAATRNAYPFVVLLFLAFLWRRRRAAWWLLLGVLAANLFVWAVTNYPLQRLYALGVGQDRVNNVAFCQVVAAGNSPLETWQVGQSHLERNGRPHHVLWGLLVAALSGWRPERVLTIYAFLPLVMAWAVALAFYFCLGGDDGEGAWSGWERAFVAGSATLLSSAPFDFTGPYGGPWGMTFLLKPNHALGLALFPAVLWAFARARGWRGRLLAAALLHGLAWAFVLDLVYVALGLVIFALLSWLGRREDRRRDVLDVLVGLGLNVLIAAPIVLSLVMERVHRESDANSILPPASSHLLEATVRAGGVFLLGAWGALLAYRRGDRMGRLLSAQVLGALFIWLGYAGLSALNLVEQPDEINYWLRFLVGAAAGVGAWDLISRAARLWPSLSLEPSRRAAAAVLLALPWTLPYWWDPARMDRYFKGSTAPLPEPLQATGEFLRAHTPARAVLAGDEPFARWAAALGARRSLLSTGTMKPYDYDRRRLVLETLFRAKDADTVRGAAAPYAVTHLVATPAVLARYGVSLADMDARRYLRRVFTAGDPAGEFLAVFEIVARGP
jgi:hypothetical protein